jgi:hypothetical protein
MNANTHEADDEQAKRCDVPTDPIGPVASRWIVLFIVLILAATTVASLFDMPDAVTLTLLVLAAAGFTALVVQQLRDVPYPDPDDVYEERFCPKCRYDLRASNEQPDGRVVCPECGGAWRFVMKS